MSKVPKRPLRVGQVDEARREVSRSIVRQPHEGVKIGHDDRQIALCHAPDKGITLTKHLLWGRR
jgi:hypothetical protein